MHITNKEILCILYYVKAFRICKMICIIVSISYFNHRLVIFISFSRNILTNKIQNIYLVFKTGSNCWRQHPLIQKVPLGIWTNFLLWNVRNLLWKVLSFCWHQFPLDILHLFFFKRVLWVVNDALFIRYW